MPLFVFFAYGAEQLSLFVFTLLVALFISFTHRSNIHKLMNGESAPDFRKRLFGVPR